MKSLCGIEFCFFLPNVLSLWRKSKNMEILNQYFYGKGKVVGKAVGYTLLSALFVFIGVFCFTRWDLSFMFSDWKGWLIIGIYALITLGTILSTVINYRKIAKANRNVPALAVATDRFIIYDSAGLPTMIPYEDCEQVKVKSVFRYRGAPPTLKLDIKYHVKTNPDNALTVEIDLSELDRPQNEVDKQLKKAYKKYKSGTLQKE